MEQHSQASSVGSDRVRPAIVAAGDATILWVGPADDPELTLARADVGGMASVHDAASPAAALAAPPTAFADRSPTIVLLASPGPASWSPDDAVRLSRRWPLAPVVSVATTLLEGRRRSGPAVPGVEEVPWHELAGRVAWWLTDLAAGAAGTLGMPATSRREERIAEAAARIATLPAAARRRAAVAAVRPGDLGSLVDLVETAGCLVTRRVVGRPRLADDDAVVFWDVGTLAADHLTWIALLTANRPGLRLVAFEAFPRGDSTHAALRAGAVAVLGRPVSLEAAAGTILRLESPAFRR